MTLAIMQPYFFPYLGYFYLIKNSDKFILLDTVQFIRHGWIERNRVLKPNEGWQYIAASIEKPSSRCLISEISLKNNLEWKAKLLRQLEHYKKAPYYAETIDIIQKGLNEDTFDISEMNKKILETICEYLSIKTEIKIFSQLNLKIEEVEGPGDWALNISKAFGASKYINPSGGKELFDLSKFSMSNISIEFMINEEFKYSQRRKEFENSLSIIDVLMFNSPSQINDLLDNHFKLIRYDS